MTQVVWRLLVRNYFLQCPWAIHEVSAGELFCRLRPQFFLGMRISKKCPNSSPTALYNYNRHLLQFSCCAIIQEYNLGRRCGVLMKHFKFIFLSVSFRFWHGEYRVAVNINDYLDIYCPYYEGPPSHGRMERYILFMVNHEGYTTCQHRMRGFKRWECNRPSGPDGPLRFSEKFQLFTPFSLGFEFRPGHEYYYICESTTQQWVLLLCVCVCACVCMWATHLFSMHL